MWRLRCATMRLVPSSTAIVDPPQTLPPPPILKTLSPPSLRAANTVAGIGPRAVLFLACGLWPVGCEVQERGEVHYRGTSLASPVSV